jgi:hypothetical protein
VLPFFVKGEKNLNQPKSDFRGTTGMSKLRIVDEKFAVKLSIICI